MAEMQPQRDLQEIADVRDPDARRALRAIHQDLNESMQRHQLEIEALVQILLEKRVMSMSEYRLHLSRLQQGLSQRGERIHEALSSVGRSGAAPASGPARMPDTDTSGRYRLDG